MCMKSYIVYSQWQFWESDKSQSFWGIAHYLGIRALNILKAAHPVNYFPGFLGKNMKNCPQSKLLLFTSLLLLVSTPRFSKLMSSNLKNFYFPNCQKQNKTKQNKQNKTKKTNKKKNPLISFDNPQFLAKSKKQNFWVIGHLACHTCLNDLW